jgi:hypothetical protein
MQQTCHQCSARFEVTDEDLAFLDKLSPVFAGKKYTLPVPTECPMCRHQQRGIFQPTKFFFHRSSDLTGKPIVTVYPPSAPFPIYSIDEWWGDGWDDLSSGSTYDETKPFFEQFSSVYKHAPRMAADNDATENSEYNFSCSKSKNVYYSRIVHRSEDVLYSENITGYNSMIIDCLRCYGCQILYDCTQCTDCYGSTHLFRCSNVHESHYCFDCIGCNNCLFCTNLRNKSYCIDNVQYTKEEYEDEYAKIMNGRTSTAVKSAEHFIERKLQAIHRALSLSSVERSSGDELVNCADCKDCFDCINARSCSYCVNLTPSEQNTDSMDITSGGIGELLYNSAGLGGGNYHMLMCDSCRRSSELAYCIQCFSCKNCFGCIGLKNKQYCILNRQYTKEQYEELVPEIISHMQQTGEWGRFLPHTFSPFDYDQSTAQEYVPLTKAQAEAQGFRWGTYEHQHPDVQKVIKAEDLPDAIADIPDDILNWAVQCKATDRPFRIIRQELEFYRRMNLPVPHLHPDERHKNRMALRNPRKLWDRICAKCQKPIQTTYAPDRPEIVYCDECYLSAVY